MHTTKLPRNRFGYPDEPIRGIRRSGWLLIQRSNATTTKQQHSKTENTEGGYELQESKDRTTVRPGCDACPLRSWRGSMIRASRFGAINPQTSESEEDQIKIRIKRLRLKKEDEEERNGSWEVSCSFWTCSRAMNLRKSEGASERTSEAYGSWEVSMILESRIRTINRGYLDAQESGGMPRTPNAVAKFGRARAIESMVHGKWFFAIAHVLGP